MSVLTNLIPPPPPATAVPTGRHHAPGATAPRVPAAPAAYEVAWARHQDDLRAAQRLRHVVFADELGARLRPPKGTPDGHDADLFDDFCEHLLVRTRGRDGIAQVVGTYRVLTPAAARRAGGYYIETAFDLVRLRSVRDGLAELGRACVHPAHRTGAVILGLWGGLAAFLHANRLPRVVGGASIGLRDGGRQATGLWQRLSRTHLAEPAWQVRPRLPLPVDALAADPQADVPALLKGYLRCGARVLGPPAWDPDFHTADLPLLLRLDDLPAAYRRHFGLGY